MGVMTVGWIILALVAGLLLMPVRILAEGTWQQLTLSGSIRLGLGPIPLIRLRALARLEPLRLEAAVSGPVGGERPLKLEKGRGGSPWSRRLRRVLADRLICRRMAVDIELGIASDAAATALACGALSALSRSLLTWAGTRGARRCSARVQPHFGEARYEGRLTGIFTILTGQIILGMIQSWRE